MNKSNIEIHNILALPTCCFSIECPGGSEANSLILEGKSGVDLTKSTVLQKMKVGSGGGARIQNFTMLIRHC